MPGGFDDIWLLGDTFGHADQSTGIDVLTQEALETLRILDRYACCAVAGNWEYWLTHPERDFTAKDQGKYSEQLAERRDLLLKKNNRALLDRLSGHEAMLLPEKGEKEFTLFHGCSYACHGNSDYQPQPCECYLFPRDLNIVTRGLFGNPENLRTPHFLFGHTHIPGYFVYSGSTMVNMWQFFTTGLRNKVIDYGESGQRFGINPGSAGIEGKHTPRTAVLLDTGEKNFTYLTDGEG